MQVHVWVWLTLLCLYLELQSCGENYFYWPEIREESGKCVLPCLRLVYMVQGIWKTRTLSGAAGGLVGHPSVVQG